MNRIYQVPDPVWGPDPEFDIDREIETHEQTGQAYRVREYDDGDGRQVRMLRSTGESLEKYRLRKRFGLPGRL